MTPGWILMFTGVSGEYRYEEYKTSSSNRRPAAGDRVPGTHEYEINELAAASGNTPAFWLNIQHAVELWDVRHNAWEREAVNVKRGYPHVAGPDVLADAQ